MKKKIFITVLFLFSTLLNLLAGVLIFYFWKPFAEWYLNYRPIVGVDFYNLTSYVGFLSRNFVFQVNGWRNTSYAGGPLSFDYPTLHAYLILPLLNYFSLVQSVQFYVVAATFLFFFFSYLLFTILAKDKVLSLILAIGLTLSNGLYGSLIWGGGLQYFSTQFFLPLVLLLLFKYFFSGNIKWFLLSALFTGISFLAHPQVAFTYLLPLAGALLFFYPLPNHSYLSFGKIKRILLYFLIAFVIGFPQLGAYFGFYPVGVVTNTFGYVKGLTGIIIQAPVQTASKAVSEQKAPDPNAARAAAEVVAFNKSQLNHFIDDTSSIFWSLLPLAVIVAILSFIIRKKKLQSLKLFVFLIPVLYILLFNSLMAFGIGFFQGGWYRAFWAFPLSLGIFISFAWGDFLSVILERFHLFHKFYFKALLFLASAGFFLVVGFLLYPQMNLNKMIFKLEVPGFRQQSSAFPDSLNVYINKNEQEDLKKRLTPSWMNPNDWQYRLYETDQRVNIWWNALFDMPLVKGYIDIPPGDTATGSFYWTSIALISGGGIDQLVETWGTPKKIAFNNALFLIDWFSIKNIEAEHEGSDTYNNLTSYLKESDIFSKREQVLIPGWAQLYFSEDENKPAGTPIAWHPEHVRDLTFYEVKPEYTSPILHPTNAAVLGFVGSIDGYNTIFRGLGSINVNSKELIPVRLGKYIDDISETDLKNIDGLILYGYDYKNYKNSWSKINKFVKEGGKVWIETGNDVKESDSVNLVKLSNGLPEIFPIKITKRTQLGQTWDFDPKSNSAEIQEIELKNFGPPVLDEAPWSFSVPNSTEDLDSDSEVILSNKGVPLIVKKKEGEGLVIWSGMNLPYHLSIYKTEDESNLFRNIISSIVPLTKEDYPSFKASRPSPNQVILESQNAKGVLFRENSNPGWVADLEGKGNLEIYPTGPTFYGFSYVRIPEENKSSFKVKFTYNGDIWGYFWHVLSLLTILIILDKVLLGGKIIIPIIKRIFKPFNKKIGSWWDKSEEE